VTEWKWIDPKTIHAVHEYQLAEHGGLDGVRDAGLIESALARPQNLAAYGKPDAADLAAAYAYGLAKNHGFADGNKRSAWVAARLFLADNGYALQVDGTEAVLMVEAMAAGTMDEPAVADWFRARYTRSSTSPG
jgi:death on curing protein